MSTQPKVSVVIIHYDTPHYLKTCLNSIFNQTYDNIEVIFIDNDSPHPDGLNLVEKKYADEPNLIIVPNRDNLGYAKAANQGIRMAIEGKSPEQALLKSDSEWPAPSDFEKSDYVVITNPDIIYSPDYFAKVVERMEQDKKIAGITGKVLKYDFNNNKPTDIIDTVGLFAYKNRRIIDDGQGLVDEGQFDEEAEIFGISGACPLYRTTALEDVMIMGEYLDEDFFMYKEDVDLSWRLLLFGWKNLFYPKALAYHGRGTGIYKRFSTREMLKNRMHLSKFQKHYSFKNQLLMQRKNEMWGTFFKDFFPIMFRKIALPIYITFAEPYLWKAYFAYFKQLPSAQRKRKEIMARKKLSAKEMSKWFQSKSKYLK